MIDIICASQMVHGVLTNVCTAVDHSTIMHIATQADQGGISLVDWIGRFIAHPDPTHQVVYDKAGYAARFPQDRKSVV